ncbi:MAG TPA: hypothetical protein VG873_08915 [Burkholderiales bacterium]|nr:hypothetical protein [Burkholderiales bacterium]
MSQFKANHRAQRLAHLDACKARGIRPQWEREFRYYPMTSPDDRAENARLAVRYPRAAWEHARDDDAFQAFIRAILSPAA